jgi:hypothetical protein
LIYFCEISLYDWLAGQYHEVPPNLQVREQLIETGTNLPLDAVTLDGKPDPAAGDDSNLCL